VSTEAQRNKRKDAPLEIKLDGLWSVMVALERETGKK
jgi:hypothetical protein